MSVPRKAGLLAVSATLAATTAAAVGGPVANAAPAHVDCGKPYYKVTAHHHDFKQVDEVVEVNHRNRTAKLSVVVGKRHKSTTKYGGSITFSVQAAFWKIASGSAKIHGHVTIKKTDVMSSRFTATATAGPHATITVRYGFRRYDQYIKRFVPYNKTVNTCGVRVVGGWVDAPYAPTYIID